VAERIPELCVRRERTCSSYCIFSPALSMMSLYIGTSRAMRARKTSGPSATTGRPAFTNEVLVWIVGRLGVEARIDHVGARAHEQGISIATGARGRRNADIAAGAAAVLDDHRLSQRLAERGVDQPGRDVGSAAGGKAHDHGDLALGIFRPRGGA